MSEKVLDHTGLTGSFPKAAAVFLHERPFLLNVATVESGKGGAVKSVKSEGLAPCQLKAGAACHWRPGGAAAAQQFRGGGFGEGLGVRKGAILRSAGSCRA